MQHLLTWLHPVLEPSAGFIRRPGGDKKRRQRMPDPDQIIKSQFIVPYWVVVGRRRFAREI